MAKEILADVSVSIAELKRDPHAAAFSADGFPVVVLNRNEPDFYCVPAETWEHLMERLEDAELNAIADERRDMKSIEVAVSDL